MTYLKPDFRVEICHFLRFKLHEAIDIIVGRSIYSPFVGGEASTIIDKDEAGASSYEIPHMTVYSSVISIPIMSTVAVSEKHLNKSPYAKLSYALPPTLERVLKWSFPCKRESKNFEI